MKDKNCFIFETLGILDKLCSVYELNINEKNRYSSILKELKIKIKANEIQLNEFIRNRIEKYIYSLDIINVNKNIGNFKHILDNGYAIEKEEDIPSIDLYELSANELLTYFVKIVKTVSYNQFGDILLLKYNKNAFGTGHNNLTKVCRGKIIDLKTMNIIVYPFDKFFNLNESEEVSEKNVFELLKNAKSVVAMDKVDGSTITVTNNNGKLIVSTNGNILDIRSTWAREILNEKYNEFYNNVQEGYSFIFELIYPDDKKVVDYNGKKDLILLGIRDLTTYRLFNYEEVKEFGKNNKLNIVKCDEFTNLNDFINRALLQKNVDREGWVIRIITDREDIMVKLKLAEYCVLHQLLLTEINPYSVYHLIREEKLDDTLATLSDKIQVKLVENMAYRLTSFLSEVEDSLVNAIDDVSNKFDITPKEFMDIKLDRNHPKRNVKIKLMKYLTEQYNDYFDYKGTELYYSGYSISEIMKSIDECELRKIFRKQKVFMFERKNESE